MLWMLRFVSFYNLLGVRLALYTLFKGGLVVRLCHQSIQLYKGRERRRAGFCRTYLINKNSQNVVNHSKTY